jgi:glycerol uptake facilitator-like aquaporin
MLSPGGHINPAVTIALATYRGFPWKKVPVSDNTAFVCFFPHILHQGYIAAQTMGGLVGAALVYANYYHAIVGIAFRFFDPDSYLADYLRRRNSCQDSRNCQSVRAI